MHPFVPVLAALVISLAAAYLRIGLRPWTAAVVVAIVGAGWLAGSSVAAIAIPLVVFAAIAVPLNLVRFRRRKLSAPVLAMFQKVMPKLSGTEQIALDAGTVGFEGELFSGQPDWKALLAEPKPVLSVEEQAFLDGPVEELCRMVDDWEITHERADLPPDMWDFLKKNKFFGMIIPKEYGGLGFSAIAHSAVLQKIAGMSTTLVSTVAVPNSLGPGELIVHYGTNEQKD
jgi:acyl-CoA dehydrogenase